MPERCRSSYFGVGLVQRQPLSSRKKMIRRMVVHLDCGDRNRINDLCDVAGKRYDNCVCWATGMAS